MGVKKQKAVSREKYLSQFSRSARWRLGSEEAAEAISDYRELVYQEERDESKLVEELGDPVQAAWMLTDAKIYRRWLMVFAVLAFGLFLLAKWAWMGHTRLQLAFAGPWWYPIWVMAVGMTLSLYWFRLHGQKSGPLSKRLFAALAVVFAVGFATLYWAFCLCGASIYERLPDGAWSAVNQVRLWSVLEMYTGLLSALAALAGLVLAKCYDRRWLALYLLGVTVTAMFGFVMFHLRNMSLDRFVAADMLQQYLALRLLPIGAAGLAGTGVALC